MDKSEAIQMATRQLNQLLDSQQNMLASLQAHEGNGEGIADLCITFIETYANWLMKQDLSPD